MRTRKLILFLFFFVGCLFVVSMTTFIFFPFESCQKYPLLKYDFAYHFTNSLNSATYTRSHLTSWGFNPFQGGGYIEGHGLSTRVLIPFSILFHGLFNQPHYIFNILIWLIIVSIPVITSLATKFFTSNKDAPLFTFFYTSIYLFGTAIGNEFIYVGHFGFLFSMALSLLSIGYLQKYVKCKMLRPLIFHGIFASLSIWTHVLAVVLIVPSYFFLLLTKKLSLRQSLVGIVILSITILLPNMFWLPGFFRYLFRSHKWTSMGQYLQTNQITVFTHTIMEPLVVCIIGSIIIGYFFKIKHGRIKSPLFSFVVGIATIMFLGGTQLALNDFQPLRFIIPIMMLIIMLLSSFKNIVFHVLIVLTMVPFVAHNIINNNFSAMVGCGFPDERGENLLSFIRERIKPTNKRIHLQVFSSTPYYQIRIASLIPYYTKVPVVALPMPFPVTFPTFIDNVLFGKTLDQLSNEMFFKYSDLYNIGYYIVHSEAAKKYFREIVQAQAIYQDDVLTIFDIKASASNYCYQCSALVTLEGRYLNIDNIKTPTVILKYHHNKVFSANYPDVVIRETMILDDPVPYIKIDTGFHSSIKIKLGTDLLAWCLKGLY